MRSVYFVPGFAGSQLFGPPPLSELYWVSYSNLITGGLIVMGLGADGVNPQGLCQERMSVGMPLPAYYSTPITQLQQQLGTEWQVIPWGWDWRQDIRTAGAALAAAIQAMATATNPAVIVGHSAGGLVARVAWSILMAANQQALVSRIITLGTPHQGSYSALELLSGGNSTLLALAGVAYVASNAAALLDLPPPGCAAVTLTQCVAVVATWPAVYELLPFLGSADEAADPNRPLIYQVSNWQHLSPPPQWLALASGAWDTLMAAAASMPPPQVLTTIAGTGFPTPDILVYPQYLGGSTAYGSTGAGDGAVTLVSGLVPQSVQYAAVCGHADLPAYYVANGIVAAEVQAVRVPPFVPPPIQMESISVPPQLGAPPYTQVGFPSSPLFGGMGPGGC